MATYEYECGQHGYFESERPMHRSGEPADCPECGESSRRVLSAPQLLSLDGVRRKAMSINERSQHEPRLVHREHTARAAPPSFASGHGRPWALGH